jgi:hypothetical protein
MWAQMIGLPHIIHSAPLRHVLRLIILHVVHVIGGVLWVIWAGFFLIFFLNFLDLPVEHQVMFHGYIYTRGAPPILYAIGNIFKKKSHPPTTPYPHGSPF